MSLKKLTVYVIIGLSYNFIFGLVGTIYPQIFKPLALAVTIKSIHFLVTLAFMFFFYNFSMDYARDVTLKTVSFSVFAGFMFSAFLEFFEIAFMLSRRPDVYRIRIISEFVSWIVLLLLLIFFIVFLREEKKYELKLTGAIVSGICGISIFFIVKTVAIANYLIIKKTGFTLMSGFYMKIPFVILMPLLIVAYALYIYFYVAFYKSLAKNT